MEQRLPEVNRSGRPINVLLISPGYSFVGDGNFGDTHLVALGSYLRATTTARVDLLDLDYEALLPEPRAERMFDQHYDVVGISCYSSFEYLKSFYLGVEIRRRHPKVCLVVGGYHPSARPADFTNDESPFDHVVVGEGELPLARIVTALAAGERLEQRILGPEMVWDLDQLPMLDWTLLDRYRPIAHRVGAQATLYLSRGCPFRCVFCMEAAKGKRSWRPYSPERAEAELMGLHRYLDLTNWKVFFTDPLFALKPGWRVEMLERLQRLDLPVSKFWALSRADVLDEKDIERFHKANFGLGFGLESGDPEMLAVIHKGGRPEAYLDRFTELSSQASTLGFAWGANVINGHPAETVGSMERSAAWIGRFFAENPKPTGFLSVDPYRFYPGSPIAEQLDTYHEKYGTLVHRKNWWNYSEMEFTSMWVDPSRELDFRTRERLTLELFGPICRDLGQRYAYQGPAAPYFRRSVDHQLKLMQPKQQLAMIRCWALWRRLSGQNKREDARLDAEAAQILQEQRQVVVDELETRLGALEPDLRRALVEVPRERFMSETQLTLSAEDRALPLLKDNTATISAIHAYAINYKLLQLSAGDRLLELGGGTGYGAALAQRIVGPGGLVRSVEVAARLADYAAQNLRRHQHVEVVSAAAPSAAEGFNKVLYCYALGDEPLAMLACLPPAGSLLAPLRDEAGQQRLILWRRDSAGKLHRSDHGPVLYVDDRFSTASQAPTAPPTADR